METNVSYGLIIPQCIIFEMVRNDAYSSSMARNPFNFDLFGLQIIWLTVNGEEAPFLQALMR